MGPFKSAHLSSHFRLLYVAVFSCGEERSALYSNDYLMCHLYLYD